MQRDMFFYSGFCRFSTDVTDLMTKHNIRQSFVFICVDNKNYNIPKFIDRVPSILKQTGEVFTDDELFKYLETKYKNTSSQDISPIMSVYGNSTSYSSAFSSIEENDDEDNPNYLNLGRDQHTSVINSPGGGEDGKKTDDSAKVSKALEMLKESRNSDDKFLKQSLGGMKV